MCTITGIHSVCGACVNISSKSIPSRGGGGGERIN